MLCYNHYIHFYLFYKIATPREQGPGLQHQKPWATHKHTYYSALKKRFNKYFFFQFIREKKGSSLEILPKLYMPHVIFKIFCQQK